MAREARPGADSPTKGASDESWGPVAREGNNYMLVMEIIFKIGKVDIIVGGYEVLMGIHIEREDREEGQMLLFLIEEGEGMYSVKGG